MWYGIKVYLSVMEKIIKKFSLLTFTVLLSLVTFTSCDNDNDDDVDDLNGTIWYHIFESTPNVTYSQYGYALYFGKKTVEWVAINDHYHITEKYAVWDYHLSGNTLHIENQSIPYSPNAIYVGNNLFERYRTDKPQVTGAGSLTE